MSDIIQGSPEWHALRLGKVTASRVSDVVAKTKTGWGASRANYAAELIAQRLTGVAQEGFTNAAMQWGTDNEAEARAAYSFHTDNDVTQIAFCEHPTIAMSGASPDGLVLSVGLVEIKCPNTATHIETLLGQAIPEKYALQMQWQMACTGREWCDFVSYDPRLPPSMRLWVKRLERDAELIDGLEANVCQFIGEIDARVAALLAKYDPERLAA